MICICAATAKRLMEKITATGRWSSHIVRLEVPVKDIVATIGKLSGLGKEERVGWEELGRILDGKPRPEPGLFEEYEEPPLWATVRPPIEPAGSLGRFFQPTLLLPLDQENRVEISLEKKKAQERFLSDNPTWAPILRSILISFYNQAAPASFNLPTMEALSQAPIWRKTSFPDLSKKIRVGMS